MTHLWRSRAWQELRSGGWLTVERARAYSLILLALYAIFAIGWIALSHHLIDRNGKPLGTDFSSFYAAGSLVLDGRVGDVYDMAAHYAREQQMFGNATPYYAWLYPPIFLFVATPLALMPYPLALAVWQGASLALYFAVIALILRETRRQNDAVARTWLLVAAAFPAVFINLGHGQNGLLTAGLLGAALVVLPRRPLLAAVLFGLLAYKPQFALLVPFALAAAGRWRALIVAGVTVLALAGASALAFGPEIWRGFAASSETARKLLLEQGDVGFEKLQSVFAVIRLWGGGVAAAYLVQGAASLMAICSVAWIWRTCSDHNLRAAHQMAATLLASPHVLDYDLALLAPAIAFLAAAHSKRPFRNYEVSLLAAVWIAPLLARDIAGVTAIPLGLAAVLSLYVLTLRQAALARNDVGAGQWVANVKSAPLSVN